jgi:AcrR family transcriptional regulator
MSSDAQNTPTRRQRQAAETRREILEVAQRLFLARGYAATSIRDIAAEAGVAVQTIYSSIGSKADLAAALGDHMDESAGVASVWAQVRLADDPAEVINLAVGIPRAFAEGETGSIVRAVESAAAVEPEMAAVLTEGARRHRDGARGVVGMVADRFGLRDGVTVEHGAATFAAMTGAGVWRELTEGQGWSFDEAHQWIAATLVADLLGTEVADTWRSSSAGKDGGK